MEENKRIRNFFTLIFGAILFIFSLCVEKEKDTDFVAGSGIWGKAGKSILEEAEKWKENKTAVEQGNQKDEFAVEEEKQEDGNTIEEYYGTYRIVEFCPTIYYYRAYNFSRLTKQEADMMLGRTIILEKDVLFTCESDRTVRLRREIPGFEDNHMITEYRIENPQYSWVDLTPETMEENLADRHMKEEFPQYYDKIVGKIEIQIMEPFGTHWYYAIKGEEKMILQAPDLHSQYFILEKIENTSLEYVQERKLSEEEQEDIRQSFYGSYTVTEFLPTKYYPETDSNKNEILPEEEAKLMLGKTVSLTEGSCKFYDNFRRIDYNSEESVERLESGYWLEEVEIENPDYQIKMETRSKIYGLRDEMLPEEMEQDEYVEINVYPGFETWGNKILLQFYRLEDGRLLMRAMEQYFLLEKN